jgi:hypothetical protein
MIYTGDRPYADPDVAARKLVEIANTVEAVQDGRINIELINAPMLALGCSPNSTGPGSIWRSRGAGWCCTRVGHSRGLPWPVQICLPNGFGPLNDVTLN